MRKKTLLLHLLLLLSYLSLHAQAPSIEWQECLGGSYMDYGTSIQVTSDGGYIMAGETYGAVPGYHGVTEAGDYLVIKLDNRGAVQWLKCLGGTYYDAGVMVRQAPDGSYIVGGQAASKPGDGDVTTPNHGGTDYWLVKLDAGGNILWQKGVGGEKNEYLYDFQVTPDGGYILAGETESTGGDVSGNHGGRDCWIVKLNNLGNIDWQKCIGGSLDDEAHGVQVLSDGYIIGGNTNSNDGNISGNHGLGDMLAAKLDLNGNIVWTKALGSSGREEAWGVVKSADGGFLLGGYTEITNNGDVSGNHGDDDVWVVKLDGAGNLQWQHCYGGSYNEVAYSVAATPDGGYVLAGSAESSNGDVTCMTSAHQAGWVLKISSTGVLQWQKVLSGGYSDTELGVSPTPDGGIIVGGYAVLSTVQGYHKDNAPSHVVGDFYAAKLGVSTATGAPVSVGISAPPANNCAGSSITLTATATGVSSGISYKWFRNGFVINVTGPVYTASDFSNNDQVYCQIMAQNNSCTLVPYTSNTVSLSMSPLAAPKINISADAANVCSGSPLNFTATVTGGSSGPVFQWLFNGHTAGVGGNKYSSILAQGDIVSCSYSDNTACVVSGSNLSNTIIAQVLPVVSPSISITADATTICSGSSAFFSAAPINGGSSPAFQWQINGLAAGSGNPFYSSTLADHDVVSCLLSSSALCSDPVTVSSNVIPVTVILSGSSTIQVDHSPAAVCSGTPISFVASPSSGLHPIYQWQINGVTVGSGGATFTSSTLAKGDVITCLLSDAQGCKTSSEASVTPVIYTTPIIGTAAPLLLSKGQGITLKLPVMGEVATYSWSPSTGLSDPSVANPLATPLQSIDYLLLVESAEGCRDTGEIKVNVFSKLAIAGAFSPNNDGHNDVFYVMGGPVGSIVRDFLVFDRWGRMLFQVHDVPPDDKRFGWNGTTGGQAALPGTYVYEIRMGFADGTQQVFKGTVMVVR